MVEGLTRRDTPLLGRKDSKITRLLLGTRPLLFQITTAPDFSDRATMLPYGTSAASFWINM